MEAVLGIVIIVLLVAFWRGILGFVVIAVVAYLIFVIVRAVVRARSRKKELQNRTQAIADREARASAEFDRVPQLQENEVRRFYQSDLVRTMADELFRTYGKPYEIRVYDDRIEADYSNMSRCISFLERRVTHLTPVVESGSSCDAIYRNSAAFFLRPQVAFAEALKRLGGGDYDIKDMAESREYNIGDSWFYTYRSKYVLLRIRANRNF